MQKFDQKFRMLISLFMFCMMYSVSDGKPNIIFLLADDLGWNDLSFHGSPQIPTPNLDDLARQGIILNNHYVMPLCTPSRAALMTGLYPIHTGMQHYVILDHEPWGLPLNITILPQHLQNLGYRTHAVGKWHLGFFRKEYTPTYRGFDSHYGFWGSSEDYYNRLKPSDEYWGFDFYHNMNFVDNSIGNYSTDLFGNHAAKLIQEHDVDTPLFLYVAYQAVHNANAYDKWQAPYDYVSRFPSIQNYKRRIYAGMTSALDKSVQTIVSALKSKNMLENSIIVFSSDNGGAVGGFDDGVASNWPLRGVKSSLWEGGVRGISFIWSPLLKNTGRTSNDLMHISDWLPTLYFAAGGNVSDLGEVDGYNLWNTLSFGEASPRSEVLLNIDPIFNTSALRVGKYKIIQGTVHGGTYDGWYGPSGREKEDEEELLKETSSISPAGSEITCRKPQRMSPCFPVLSPCLFDLDEDPCERNNLADEKPDVLNDLLERLSFYENSAVPPRNKPKDPRCDPKLYNRMWTNWMDYVEGENLDRGSPMA